MGRSTTWRRRWRSGSPRPVSPMAPSSGCRSPWRSRALSGSRTAWRGGSNGARGDDMARGFVGVGSNVDPEENVARGLRLVDAEVGVRSVSTFYRTPALDRPQDPPFVNGVIEVGDEPGPLEMKALLQRVEHRLGRKRTEDRYGPR